MAQETMTRLFTFKYTLRYISKEGKEELSITEETRHLDIADIVIVDGEMMRIMEEPEEGVIWVCYNNPSKGDTWHMKHENDVDSVVGIEYNEWW